MGIVLSAESVVGRTDCTLISGWWADDEYTRLNQIKAKDIDFIGVIIFSSFWYLISNKESATDRGLGRTQLSTWNLAPHMSHWRTHGARRIRKEAIKLWLIELNLWANFPWDIEKFSLHTRWQWTRMNLRMSSQVLERSWCVSGCSLDRVFWRLIN